MSEAAGLNHSTAMAGGLFVHVESQLHVVRARDCHVAIGAGNNCGLTTLATTTILVKVYYDNCFLVFHFDRHVLHSQAPLRRFTIIFPTLGAFHFHRSFADLLAEYCTTEITLEFHFVHPLSSSSCLFVSIKFKYILPLIFEVVKKIMVVNISFFLSSILQGLTAALELVFHTAALEPPITKKRPTA